MNNENKFKIQEIKTLSDINQITKMEEEVVFISDIKKKAEIFLELGLVEAFRKNYEKAIKHLEDAQQCFLELNDISQIATCLAEIAYIHYLNCNDRLIRSLTLLNDAKYLLENQPGTNEAEAIILHYYGLINYQEKRYSEALKYYKNAQALLSSDSIEYAKILDSLAVFYLRVNNHQMALKTLKKSLKIKQTFENKREMSKTELLLGRYLSSIESYDESVQYLSSALSTTVKLGDSFSSGRIYDELAKIYIILGNIEKAKQYCNNSIAIAQSINAPLIYAFTSCTLANVKIQENNPQEAIDVLFNNAESIFLEFSSPRGYAYIKQLSAIAYDCIGNSLNAIENMHEAVELFREAKVNVEVAKCYYELAKIYKNNNDIPMALSSVLEALRIAKKGELPILTEKIENLLFELDEEEWTNIINKTAKKEELFSESHSLIDTLALIENFSPVAYDPRNPLLSLLRIGRSVAAETDVDKLLEIITEETKKALTADRCTVFILDREKNELWSKIALGMGSQEIRFPAHMGLAGHVSMTGETINIKDAYNDNRFNKEIDKKTGYKTQTILCMPMRNLNHQIIGVFQVLNKTNGTFTPEDEDLLIAIGSSAGIALENARLFKKQQIMYEEQKRSFISFINTLAASIDARDKITSGHSKRVTDYSLSIAQELGMSTVDIEILEYAAMLHDFGKIGIKDSVLCKEGKLTEEEYKHIQEHVFITNEILKKMFFEEKFKDVPEIASSHHEKYDGTGYFRKLHGKEIPLGGRILAVADVFDAITSKRHYRSRMPFLEVLNILKKGINSHFDPIIIDKFFEIKLDDIMAILLSDIHQIMLEEEKEFLSKYTVKEFYTVLSRDYHDQADIDKKIIKVFEKYYNLKRPIANEE